MMSPVLVTFIAYLLIIFVIAFVATRRTRNFSDYTLAGRCLSGPISALGSGTSDMSGWLLMALPGAAYLAGVQAIWLPIGLALGAFFNWLLVAPRLRVYTQVANDALTIPAYFDHRFKSNKKILRVVTATVLLVFFTFYTSAGFVAAAKLAESIFHLSYGWSLAISALALILYTAIGGFLAISWIDFFQGTLMFLALIIVPFVVLHENGGWHVTVQNLASQASHYFDAFHGISLIGTLSLLAWGLGYFGQPHILVRFMATRSLPAISSARLICMVWMILALYGSMFTGIFGHAYFAKQPLADAETVFLELAKLLFNPWIGGILVAAVLSAIMSTSSSQLLACSSALSEDFYRTFLRPKASTKELVLVARIGVLLIAAIAIGLASNPDGTILSLVAYAWGGLGASFGPLMLLSLYWRRITHNGAVAGMIVGALVFIVWEILGHHFTGIFQLYSLLPAFILSSLAIIIVSLLDTQPSASVQSQHDQFVQTLRHGHL